MFDALEELSFNQISPIKSFFFGAQQKLEGASLEETSGCISPRFFFRRANLI